MHARFTVVATLGLWACSPMTLPEGITFTRPSGGGAGVLFTSCNQTTTSDPDDAEKNPTTLADRSFTRSCTLTDLTLAAKTSLARTQDTLTVSDDFTGQATSRHMVTVPSGAAFSSLPIEVCGTPPAGKRLKVLVTLDGALTSSGLGAQVTQKIELISPRLERKADVTMPSAGASVQSTYTSAEGPGRQCVSLRVVGQLSLTPPIQISAGDMTTVSATSKATWVLSATLE